MDRLITPVVVRAHYPADATLKLNRNTQDWYSHICGSEVQDTVEPAIVRAPSRASLRAVRARVSQSAVV
jgi:hypothetical protein